MKPERKLDKLEVREVLTLSEYRFSKYPMKEAKNYGMEHLVTKELMRWTKFDNIQVFIVEADPEYNYGLDFKALIRYQLPDEKLIFIKQISYNGSSLNSFGFRQVTSPLFLDQIGVEMINRMNEAAIDNDDFKLYMDIDQLTIWSETYDRTNSNRRIIASLKWTVCTDL